MLYSFQLNALNSIDAQTKVELKIPQLTLAKIAQMGRHETVKTSEHYSPRTTVLGLRVQSLLEVTFFAEFIMIYFRKNSIAAIEQRIYLQI